MANFNRVILAGNLTRDPELSYTPANTAVCKFGLAINRQWTDKQSNERRHETTFVDLTAFGRQGEVINQYLRKGRPILIEGRLQFSQWTTTDGQKRSKLAVVAERFQFIDSRQDGGGEAGGSGAGEQAPPVSEAGQASPPAPGEPPGPPPNAEVPF
ncbi:MAG: single-stranded DNA-binding protein [Planctomycetes bacterium]|nr:single-stranded DNA-binding protein [Planctomycetota bacterium]